MDRAEAIGYIQLQRDIERRARKLLGDNPDKELDEAFNMAIEALQEPPRPKGRWIEKPYLLGVTWYCNICGENYGMPHGIYNYCPNCGADMRGEKE